MSVFWRGAELSKCVAWDINIKMRAVEDQRNTHNVLSVFPKNGEFVVVEIIRRIVGNVLIEIQALTLVSV